MKSLRLLVILSTSMLFISGNLLAKQDYKSFFEEDGIEFSYKWKHSKFLKKDSPIILFLKIENANDYHASVEFTVDYFWKSIRHSSSDPQIACIKANKSAKGKIRKLTFEKGKLSDEDILSDDFILEISDFEALKVLNCKRKK